MKGMANAMKENLPIILSALTAVLTLFVNYRLKVVKDRSQQSNKNLTAESEFRDDLLEMIASLNVRIEKHEAVVEQRNKIIEELRAENARLTLDSLDKQRAIQRLTDDIAERDRRIYYKPRGD